MPFAILATLVVVGLAGWRWMEARDEAAEEAARREREDARAEAHAHLVAELREESHDLLHDVLPGVSLGDDVDAVRAGRPDGALAPSTQHADPGYALYEERMANGAQVMYAFDDESGELVRIQMLSQLDDVNGIVPHFGAMNDRYGPPTGIWDCRDEGGMSTRRFTWRGTHAALADIVLVYGNRVSLTLYVTSNEQMAASLHRAHCVPASEETLEQFPTTSADAIERAQREEEERAP
jgi:hypothetical protein